MTNPLSVYFAGELFSAKALVGNAILAQAIHAVSESRYHCILPQNLEQRETTSAAIRNQDLFVVATCDVGLFHFDGTELDSGTVVEYMIAKFLDIPSVLLRTDFRKSGDDQDFPWNLMLSNFPRTKVVSLDAMLAYQTPLREKTGAQPSALVSAACGVEAGITMSQTIAEKVVAAMDAVCAESPVLSQDILPSIYQWMRYMPGAHFDRLLSPSQIEHALKRRIERERN